MQVTSPTPLAAAIAAANALPQKPAMPEIPDERRLFRSRIIRAYRLAPVPSFTRRALREVMTACRYPWLETEFQLMVRDGVLIRDTGAHGDEDLYLPAEGIL